MVMAVSCAKVSFFYFSSLFCWDEMFYIIFIIYMTGCESCLKLVSAPHGEEPNRTLNSLTESLIYIVGPLRPAVAQLHILGFYVL